MEDKLKDPVFILKSHLCHLSGIKLHDKYVEARRAPLVSSIIATITYLYECSDLSTVLPHPGTP